MHVENAPFLTGSCCRFRGEFDAIAAQLALSVTTSTLILRNQSDCPLSGEASVGRSVGSVKCFLFFGMISVRLAWLADMAGELRARSFTEGC